MPGMSGRVDAALLLGALAHADIEHAVDRDGVDLDHDLAGAGDGVGDVLEAQDLGPANLMDDDGLHRRGNRGTGAPTRPMAIITSAPRW